MKHLIVTVGIVLTAGTLFAQNDRANAVKYWKFRTDFREEYIKIGSNQGESLPARSLNPQNFRVHSDYSLPSQFQI
jgi:hypothetical protein